MTSVQGTQEDPKYAVLIGDGMADQPLDELDGHTPLEAATTPNMDMLATRGQSGMVSTIPRGMPPGSDVAILSVLGYDPAEYYSGRAPLEAAKIGIELSENETAFRCNFITTDGKAIIDYAAGHVTSEEAQGLISFLNEKLGSEDVKFFAGVSYRNICVLKGIAPGEIACTPPHDVIGEPLEKHLPVGDKAGLVRDLMKRTISLLGEHQINRSRISRSLKPANMIWLWGQGTTPSIPPFRKRFGLDGGVISAVDLVQGLAKLLGLDRIDVPGATGYYDTNYQAKGEYASEFLRKKNFVLVHVEAPDEASHNGDLEQKIKAIESFDKMVVGPVYRELSTRAHFRIMVLPDHPTPIRLRTHTGHPVPFVCCGQGIGPSYLRCFSEPEAEKSGLKYDPGHDLMEAFIKKQKW